MAEGPINYSAQLVQPDFEPLLQGLQLRKQNHALDQQAAINQQKADFAQTEANRKIDEDNNWRAALDTVMQNPTTAGYQNLFKFPGKLDAAKAMLGEYTDQQRDRNLTAAMEVGGLINAGAVPQAITRLKDRRTALAGAGESTEITDHIIANLESGDPAKITQAKALAGTVIATTLGEKAGPVLDSLGYGARAEDRVQDNERADRALDLNQQRTEAAIARGEAASGRAERAADRADRKASGGGGGGGSNGAYEYRIGPDGKLQRRKR